MFPREGGRKELKAKESSSESYMSDSDMGASDPQSEEEMEVQTYTDPLHEGGSCTSPRQASKLHKGMDPTEDFTLWKDKLKIVSATLKEKIPQVEQQMDDEYDLSSLMSGPRTKNAIKGLPLATMVRNNLRCFQSNAEAFSIRNRDDVTLKPMLKASRRISFYKTASLDFPAKHFQVLDVITRETGTKQTGPTVMLDHKTLTSWEDNLNVALSVSSYNEWFAHTVQKSLESVLGHMEGHKRDMNIPAVTHNIRNCLDLIDSLGKASEDSTRAMADNHHSVVRARKDSYLRKLPNVGTQLQKQMRNAPLVWSSDKRPEGADDPKFPFRGLHTKLDKERKEESERAITQLVLENKPSIFSQTKSSHKRPFAGKGPVHKDKRQKVNEEYGQPFRASNQGGYSSKPTRDSFQRGRGAKRGAEPARGRGSFSSNI